MFKMIDNHKENESDVLVHFGLRQQELKQQLSKIIESMPGIKSHDSGNKKKVDLLLYELGKEPDKDFSMLPWLLRIQKHLEADDLDAALLEMLAMKRSLQGCVPDGLDVEGDEWVDVSFA